MKMRAIVRVMLLGMIGWWFIFPAAAQTLYNPSNGWKDDGTEVRLKDANDDVGIGTATPAGKLHVTGGNAIFDDKVGIGIVAPGAPLTVNGPMIRRIARVQGYILDGTDNGALVGRSLTFTKTQSDTGIRVGWSDNFRVFNDKACRWEVRFNGASCTNPGGLVFDKLSTTGNYHEMGSFFGTCVGLPAGTYTIQGYVSPTPNYVAPDCYTGWFSQLFSIEAEEVY